MKTCYFCHKTLGTGVVTMHWAEWAMKRLETITEYAHFECLAAAQKIFEKTPDAA